MAQFEINILGCGSATPTPRHNPSSQVIDFRDNLMMIDCGEGAQSMMRRMNLRFSRLNHIFISHLHGDHCFGLPGLLSTLGLHERTGRLTIHLPAEGLNAMKSFTDFFCRESPFEIIYNPISGQGGVLLDQSGLTVEAFPLYHRVPCYGFLMKEKPKARHLRGDIVKFFNIPVAQLPLIKAGADYVAPDGQVIANERLTTDADPAVSYAYCSDTMFDERVAQAVAGVDTIYHEATYLDDLAAQARQRGHSTAAQAGRLASMAGARQLIIGHYSKRYTSIEPLVAEAAAAFPSGIVIGADEGLKVDLLAR